MFNADGVDGWFIFEEDLYSIGKKANPKDYKTNEIIKLKVDPNTGKGEIIDD